MFQDLLLAQLQPNPAFDATRLLPDLTGRDEFDPIRSFLRASWWPYGGELIIEFVLVAVLSLLAGWFIYFVLSKLTSRNERIRQLVRSSSQGLGIRRSATIFVATLLFEGVATVLSMDELSDSSVMSWIQFVRVLALGWLLAVAFEATLVTMDHRGAIQGHKQRTILLPFARKMGVVVILTLSLVTALSVIGTNVWGLVAGLGIGGIAIAFAAKDSVENIFGSFTVLLDMPFGVGDWIKVGDIEGTVEEINLRSTRIRTFEDSLITLPNSNFIKAAVENLGQRRSRRVRTTLVLEPPTPAADLAGFCDALRTHLGAMPESIEDSVFVSVYDIKETGVHIQIAVRFEVNSYAEEVACRQAILLEAVRLLETHNLEFRTQTSKA